MSRGLFPLLAGIALVVALIGSVVATGFVLPHVRQAAFLNEAATPTPGGNATAPAASMYPPELAFLSQLSPQQRFDHLGPTQTTIYNPQGQEVIVIATPGQVATVTGNTVTLNVNTPPGGTAASQAFTVTPTTWVMGRPHQGNLLSVAQGDRVVVYSIGSSTNATAITQAHGMGYHGGMMGGGGGMESHQTENAG